MCATFEFNRQIYKPGKKVVAVAASGIVRHAWAGFAREEILDWWQRKGGILLDIYADRFAERSNATGKLIWDQVPERLVIRGVLDQQAGGEPLVKIVTRASSHGELERYQHPRMPVLAAPLFPIVEIPETPEAPQLF